ncbi:hypothetical protein HMPREF1071_00969 [Bacteroides salyersiae CL02T12C01]|uniref:DNA primase n=1 Tax=Bacteroides salyersiae CL02T12C01 TaxID=997887 RepID=I8YY26_9BACE|nr:hypothetical protein HMPREF1071_00969 [Bacteroides salyersiae CL02T12C01]
MESRMRGDMQVRFGGRYEETYCRKAARRLVPSLRAATGGDLVELGKHLYQTDSVSEVLAYIGKHENAIPIQRVRIPGTTPRPVEADMKDVLVVPLQHHALLSYLHSRGIDGDIGRMFCREVHYELRQRRYFALAFGNVAGGYEVRNPYYKGCIRCKDISVIRHSHSEAQNRVCVFEGFMDFLSYLTLKQTGDDTVCIGAPCDYLVMNSVNNLKKALEHLQVYEEIHCYLDNDLAGQKTEETIAGMYGKRVHNEALRYHEYKDLNDYLRGKKR